MTDLEVRAALPAEAAELSALALSSKAHWGYDQAFLDAVRDELSFAEHEVVPRRTTVATRQDRLVGFYTLENQPPDGELGHLWIAPGQIGTGVGRLLWEHAVRTARELGFERLRIDSDPHAEGFYKAMGARRVGETPSGSIPDRKIPLMMFALLE